MKLKGVNAIEQHIEKIVLALMLVLLLGVLSVQFVFRPNDVEVSKTHSVSPDQVYTVLEGQANQLKSQLSDRTPELPELQSVDLVARYNQAFERDTGAALRLSSALGQGINITGATGATVLIPTIKQGPVAALKVPITSTPIAQSKWSTLDPYAVLEVPEFASFVPDVQPFDFPSVSVEALFSGKDLQSALTGQDGSPAIPRRFWSASGLAIMGFEAERQKLMPDGSWGEPIAIVTPPHTPKPIMAISEDAGLLELTDLVTTASKVIDEVVRPMFPPTISGELWEPPSDQVAVGNDTESSAITRLERRLKRSKGELARLTNAPSTDQRRTRTNTRQRPGGGKTGRDDRNSTPPPSNNNRNQTRIQKLRDDIKSLEDQLKELGVKGDDLKDKNRARTSKNDVVSILEEESIELWAHDLGVEPGATYRYHTRVVVNNPLFRKSSELDPDDAAQQALTLDPFARGAWSEWSEPIVVGAKDYFFVTKAESADGIGLANAKATVELYRMFYGHYRRSTLTVSPGDGLSTSVRMAGELLLFDPALINAGDAAKAIENQDPLNESALPEGISELAKRMTIDLGIYILDIYTDESVQATGLGGKAQPMRVVFRDAEGNVIVRSDVSDESSPAYALASSSSSAASDTPLRAPGAPAISPAAALFEPKGP